MSTEKKPTAKKNEAAENENAVSNLEQNAVAAVDGFDAISFEFENEAQVVEVSAAYLTMQQGEVDNFIFTGMSTATFEGEEKTVVNLLSRNKESFIAANAVLVNTLKKIQPPALVRIACMGSVGTGNSKYTNFKVYTIPQSIARPEQQRPVDAERQLSAGE